VHHFDGTAGEAEGHGPEGALAGPVGDLVEGCPSVGSVKDSFEDGLNFERSRLG